MKEGKAVPENEVYEHAIDCECGCDGPEPTSDYFDDSVKFCPNCETPNQFGETCMRCIADGGDVQ